MYIQRDSKTETLQTMLICVNFTCLICIFLFLKYSKIIVVFELPSHVQFFTTPRTVASQAPLSMGFPRQKYWSGLPFLFPGDLPWLRDWICVPCLASRFFTTGPFGKPCYMHEKSKSESRSVMSGSLRPHGVYSPWNSLGQNTRVSSRSLFEGIFPTQG